MSIFKLLADAVKELVRAIFAPFGALLNSLFGGVFQTISSVFKIQPGDIKRLLLVVVSFVVIFGSLGSMFFSLRTPRPKINMKPFEALGEVLAEETIKIAGDSGTVVVITYGNEMKVPVFDRQYEMFESTLEKNSHLRVTEIERVAPDMMMMDMGGGLPSKEFLELIKKHQKATVIVSMLGSPSFTEEELRQLPKTRPKIVAGMAYSPLLSQMIRDDIVQVAITPRFTPPAETEAEPETARQWFDRFYTVVRHDNVDDLPDYM